MNDTKKLDAVFAEVFEIEAGILRDEWTVDDIELWDSLAQMELIAAIEKQFSIELSFQEITEMTSIGKIRNIISRKVG